MVKSPFRPNKARLWRSSTRRTDTHPTKRERTVLAAEIPHRFKQTSDLAFSRKPDGCTCAGVRDEASQACCSVHVLGWPRKWLGRNRVVEPYFQTVVLAGGLIEDVGSPAQREAFLPQIMAGE